MTEEQYLLAFERWWSIYPRKVSKGNARKAWLKLVKGMNEKDLEDFTIKLVGATDSQIRWHKKQLDQDKWAPDWKHPATWLNGEDWMNVLDDMAKEGKAKGVVEPCSIPGCIALQHGPSFQYCSYHLSFDEHGRMRDGLLADEMRHYYQQHKEIHGLTGHEAAKWIRQQKMGVGK